MLTTGEKLKDEYQEEDVCLRSICSYEDNNEDWFHNEPASSHLNHVWKWTCRRLSVAVQIDRRGMISRIYQDDSSPVRKSRKYMCLLLKEIKSKWDQTSISGQYWCYWNIFMRLCVLIRNRFNADPLWEHGDLCKFWQIQTQIQRMKTCFCSTCCSNDGCGDLTADFIKEKDVWLAGKDDKPGSGSHNAWFWVSSWT